MFSQKDFYKEINGSEFNEERNKNQEEFTSRERELINNTNMVDDFGNTKVRLVINVKDSDYIHIWKLEDGYFLVKNTGGYMKDSALQFRKQFYYKCDQIEGVMKLLKDLNIN